VLDNVAAVSAFNVVVHLERRPGRGSSPKCSKSMITIA
jgi:hypothetical protein